MVLQNVVQYSGSGAERKMIQEHELFFNGEKTFKRNTKFEVLLASYETVLRDKKVFQGITWQVYCGLPTCSDFKAAKFNCPNAVQTLASAPAVKAVSVCDD